MLYPVKQTSRAIIVFAKQRGGVLNAEKRPLFTSNVPELDTAIIYTNSTTLPDSIISSERCPRASKDPKNNARAAENSYIVSRLKGNFIQHPGLKLARNRDNLVSDFFDLSKSVLEKRINVDDFVATDTFKMLEKNLESSIDFMNNAHIISLLASSIRMRVDPTSNFVKLLEHEVKFRLKSFNLNQIIKLFKFYGSAEMSAEQKQLAEMLGYRIRAFIQGETTTIRELNSVLHLIAADQAPKSLLHPIEEKLLEILTYREDDMVSRYLATHKKYDYESLCNMYLNLAENGRRPTPLLKAASVELCKISSETGSSDMPQPETIIDTLGALVSLNYPHRTLISKLLCDLTRTIKLNELNSYILCHLLGSMSNLRWRSEDLLNMFFNHFQNLTSTSSTSDNNVMFALVRTAALLNYEPKVNLGEFYDSCMKKREKLADRKSRRWLTYVWSLAVLRLANESHFRSVLSSEFHQDLVSSSETSEIAYSDLMRLLNLRAIAQYELNVNGLEYQWLDSLNGTSTLRSPNMKKLSSKVREALSSIFTNPEHLSHEIQTPFGFMIDCELTLDKDFNLIATKQSFSSEQTTLPPEIRKYALVNVSYDETITNSQNEVVGHKQIIPRILSNFGYQTVFLTENAINREKTSADLTNRIRTLILDSSKS